MYQFGVHLDLVAGVDRVAQQLGEVWVQRRLSTDELHHVDAEGGGLIDDSLDG